MLSTNLRILGKMCQQCSAAAGWADITHILGEIGRYIIEVNDYFEKNAGISVTTDDLVRFQNFSEEITEQCFDVCKGGDLCIYKHIVAFLELEKKKASLKSVEKNHEAMVVGSIGQNSE